jgi:murein DD-endopeptidase MepM/ murein hydrolase activator NlpD
VYHTGFDYWTGVGDNIFSPVTGTVLYTKVNPDGLNTIVIESSKVVVRILYVGETVPKGTKVNQGDWIATAGNLANRYPGVPNHVHMTILKPDSEWAYSMDGTTRIFRDWPYPVDFKL